MRHISFYAILLPIVYALLFWLGNSDDFKQCPYWNKEVASWLGEAPPGVTTELVRPDSSANFPEIVCHIPANEELQKKIISTFQLEASYPGVYESRGISPIYPAEKEVHLPITVTYYPRLELNPDGSMRFTLSENNLREEENVSQIKSTPIPYPEYLPDGDIEMARSIMLAVLCFLLPGMFCCVGWLWVQRRPIQSIETLFICLVIPAMVAYIGAYIDFYMHGFNKSYAVFSAVFSMLSNVICAAVLLVFTGIVRWLWRLLK